MKEEGLKYRFQTECRRLWKNAGGGTMLVCVSGGADSTALFRSFSDCEIPFEAAHCNFNLRGEESIRDREFVTRLCHSFVVPLHLVEFNVGEQALQGESVEMTCRRLRYEFFRGICAKHGFSRIVTAHNADDNIETFFLNALRGSGVKGLKCMVEDNGEILRPLLKFGRKEILGYLDEIGQAYVTDSTNLESDYRRNFLRNEIFPRLETRWEGFRKGVTNTIDILQRENKIIQSNIAGIVSSGDRFLSWENLKTFPEAETLILNFIAPFGGTPVQAREMASRLSNPLPGKKWKLSRRYLAIFVRKGIKIIDSLEANSDLGNNSHKIRWEKLSNSPELMKEVKIASLSVIYLPLGQEYYEWKNVNREMRIKSLGLGGSQKVWKVLKDAGISAEERGGFKVLAAKGNSEVIWLPGIKRAALHLVDDETETVWKCEFLDD